MSWKDDIVAQYREHHKNQARFYTYLFICCILGAVANFFINGLSDWMFTLCVAGIAVLCLDKRRNHWKNYHSSPGKAINR